LLAAGTAVGLYFATSILPVVLVGYLLQLLLPIAFLYLGVVGFHLFGRAYDEATVAPGTGPARRGTTPRGRAGDPRGRIGPAIRGSVVASGRPSKLHGRSIGR